MAKKPLEPSILSFTRHLDPSDGVMASVEWTLRGDARPLPITVGTKTVRGTISNRLAKAKEEDPIKLGQEVSKPNLQKVNYASLPQAHDTLVVTYYLRVLGGVGVPDACNSPEAMARIAEMREEYGDTRKLALRYATNIVNGRALWRNGVSAEDIEILVEQIEDGDVSWSKTYDAMDVPLNHFDVGVDVEELGDRINEALNTPDGRAFFRVVAYSRVGYGMEVYPSQTMDPGRVYYRTAEGQASMTTQKIGNAIRTIDTWFNEADERGPIPIESYGSVTALGRAYRSRDHFYALFSRWLEDKPLNLTDKHYLMAMLIRGGVFSFR